MMLLAPNEIFYSQDTINNMFDRKCRHYNRLIGITLDDICEGRCSVSDVPTISVAKIDGRWVTADNRRLWVFRQLYRLNMCDTVRVNITSGIPQRKMTSYNKGVSIEVRRDPGGLWHRNRSLRSDKPILPTTRPTAAIWGMTNTATYQTPLLRRDACRRPVEEHCEYRTSRADSLTSNMHKYGMGNYPRSLSSAVSCSSEIVQSDTETLPKPVPSAARYGSSRLEQSSTKPKAVSVSSVATYDSPVLTQYGTKTKTRPVSSAATYGSPALEQSGTITKTRPVSSAATYSSPALEQSGTKTKTRPVSSAAKYDSPALEQSGTKTKTSSMSSVAKYGSPALEHSGTRTKTMPVSSAATYGRSGSKTNPMSVSPAATYRRPAYRERTHITAWADDDSTYESQLNSTEPIPVYSARAAKARRPETDPCAFRSSLAADRSRYESQRKSVESTTMFLRMLQEEVSQDPLNVYSERHELIDRLETASRILLKLDQCSLRMLREAEDQKPPGVHSERNGLMGRLVKANELVQSLDQYHLRVLKTKARHTPLYDHSNTMMRYLKIVIRKVQEINQCL